MSDLDRFKQVALETQDVLTKQAEMASQQADEIKKEESSMKDVLGKHRTANDATSSLSTAEKAVREAGEHCKKAATNIKEYINKNFGG